MTSDDFLTDPARACAPETGWSFLFTSDDRDDHDRAKQICRRRCPFQQQCLTYAVDRDERWHVWGGVVMSSAVERRHAHLGVPSTADLVRQLWEQDLTDPQIAQRLQLDASSVTEHRKRAGLPSNYDLSAPRKRQVAA
jgi:hypothetical protein